MARGSKKQGSGRNTRTQRSLGNAGETRETPSTTQDTPPTVEPAQRVEPAEAVPVVAPTARAATRVRASTRSSVAEKLPVSASPSVPVETLPLWVAGVACALLSLWFCWPVLSTGAAFGVNDWDMNLFYAEAARRSWSVHHQFPLWNPWYCGGSPLLANPQSVFLSPLFLLTLAKGSVVGVKLQIFVAQALGMFGAVLLARRAGTRGASSLLAGVVYGMTSVYTLHIATGHATWVSMGFIPYALLGACESIEHAFNERYRQAAGMGLLGALALACILFTGNAYFFVYTAMAIGLWGLITAARGRTLKQGGGALLAGAGIAVIAFGLCAIKLLPMFDFLGRVSQYEAKDESGATFDALRLVLFARDQTMKAHEFEGMQYRWWEYGAYVGILPFALAVLASVQSLRTNFRWIILGLLFLFIAMGVHGPVWPILRSVKGFEGLRVPSRTIVYFVLAASVLAAYGLSTLARMGFDKAWWGDSVARWGPAVVVGIVAIDMFSVTRPVLAEAFTLPAVTLEEAGSDSAFRQTLGFRKFETYHRYSNTFDHVVRNIGMHNCYERLHLKTAAIPSSVFERGHDYLNVMAPQAGNPAYRGEAWIARGSGQANVSLYSPNEFTVQLQSPSENARVVLNQNFDPGWQADIASTNNATRTVDARDDEGRVSVDVSSTDQSVKFVYRPRAVSRGGWISVVTLTSIVGLCAALAWDFIRRRKALAATTTP